ncbi:MAG: hypothetical protein ACE5R6_00455 [Candidatus Heimdallarchaeota archaeon]
MYLVQKNHLPGLQKREYQLLRQLTRLSKNLYNQTFFTLRQYYFPKGSNLPYESAYHYLKEIENYRQLPSQVTQQTMRVVNRTMRSSIRLSENAKKGTILVRSECHITCRKMGFLCVSSRKTCTKSMGGQFTSHLADNLRKNSEPDIYAINCPHTSGGS